MPISELMHMDHSSEQYMAIPTKSPRSSQRVRVFNAYRGRGKHTNPLWLPYSAKTNRDWILASDRQLVHWLMFLETIPTVRSFDIKSENNAFGTGYVTATLSDGRRQLHVIHNGDLLEEQRDVLMGQSEVTAYGAECIVFSDSELKPVVPQAMRWFKAMSYVAMIRDEEHIALRLALVQKLGELVQGKVEVLIRALPDFNEDLLLGMLVRLSIEGFIFIDLKRCGICYSTPWNITSRWNNVEP